MKKSCAAVTWIVLSTLIVPIGLPRKAEAGIWGDIAIGAGVAAVGYAVYRGVENSRAEEAAYNNALFSSNGYQSGGYYESGGGDYDSYYGGGSEPDPVYLGYLKRWNAARDRDVQVISALNDTRQASINQLLNGNKAPWVCSAMCVTDKKDPASLTADMRDEKLVIYKLAGEAVSANGADPDTILKGMSDTCTAKGSNSTLVAGVVKTTKGGVSNIGYIPTYGGNSCYLDHDSDLGTLLGQTQITSQDTDYKQTVTDLEFEGDVPSEQYRREAANVAVMYYEFADGSQVLSQMAPDKLDIEKQKAKGLKIQQDPITHEYVMYDSNEPANSRDTYRIHTELDRKTNAVRIIMKNEGPFSVQHACGTETHRVILTLADDRTKSKAKPAALSDGWKQMENLYVGKAPDTSIPDTFCNPAK